jgi:transposase InsO family protein
MILIKFVVLCFIVFLCASPLCELVVFDPGKWLYRTRSEGLTSYFCLSVLLPLRVRLGHLSWNNSGGSAIITMDNGTLFDAETFKDFCDRIGTKIHFASVRHTESNGLVERENGIIMTGIMKLTFNQPRGKWPNELIKVV